MWTSCALFIWSLALRYPCSKKGTTIYKLRSPAHIQHPWMTAFSPPPPGKPSITPRTYPQSTQLITPRTNPLNPPPDVAIGITSLSCSDPHHDSIVHLPCRPGAPDLGSSLLQFSGLQPHGVLKYTAQSPDPRLLVLCPLTIHPSGHTQVLFPQGTHTRKGNSPQNSPFLITRQWKA